MTARQGETRVGSANFICTTAYCCRLGRIALPAGITVEGRGLWLLSRLEG
jgi:hypothetical protein